MSINKLLDSPFVSTTASISNKELTELERATIELSEYNYEQLLPLNMSPLHWGKNAAKFPMLAHLAEKALVVQATYVASEQVLLGAGQLNSAKINGLESEMVDMLLFFNKNL